MLSDNEEIDAGQKREIGDPEIMGVSPQKLAEELLESS
jgi:hypothetical protein